MRTRRYVIEVAHELMTDDDMDHRVRWNAVDLTRSIRYRINTEANPYPAWSVTVTNEDDVVIFDQRPTPPIVDVHLPDTT